MRKTWRRPWSSNRAAHVGGFTLVEILVVLVIAGLLTSIAMPRLQRMVQSMEMASQRKTIITQLDGLGYRAYSEGRPLRLTALPDARATGEPMLQLPPGWRLDVTRPIDYSFNGLCSGGKVTILSPDNIAEPFQLKPPLCRLEPEV